MAIDKKLKAVNRMLRSIDMPQLNSWDEMDSVAFSARDELDDVSETVQAEGWYFNEETITLAVEELTGEIVVPEGVLSLQHVNDTNIIKRGDRLYDKTNNTFVFSAAQEVAIVTLFEFEDLPPEAVDYITNSATYNFQANVIGSSSTGNNLANRTVQSRITLLQIDASNRDTSILGLSDNSNFISS